MWGCGLQSRRGAQHTCDEGEDRDRERRNRKRRSRGSHDDNVGITCRSAGLTPSINQFESEPKSDQESESDRESEIIGVETEIG